MATSEISAKRVAGGKPNRYPFWSPRIWHGMLVGDWVRLCIRGRFRISPSRSGLFCTVSAFSVFNSLMAGFERMCFGRAIAKTKLAAPPLFILGHWRSGTTLLHELLVLDDRLCFPNTYQCFMPSHFLLTEAVLSRLLWILLPATRPMDNMPTGWGRPQECEFALCNLGVPSPYTRIAFPDDPPPHLNYLDMEGLSPAELDRWKSALDLFVRKVTYRAGKRLVLKSPTHTGRVKVLSELFPGSRFVHMVRHPEALFPSTVRLWQSLDTVQGLHVPTKDHLAEYVFTAMTRMYEGFEKQRAELPEQLIHDLHYEDLIRDPLSSLREIYDTHQLGDFEYVRPKVEEYLSQQKDYRTNQHLLDDDIRDEIFRRWSFYYDKYGYAPPRATEKSDLQSQPEASARG